jgi:hypothetical protein
VSSISLHMDLFFSSLDVTYALGRLDTEKDWSVAQALYRSALNVTTFGLTYKIYNHFTHPQYNIEYANNLNLRPNINGCGGLDPLDADAWKNIYLDAENDGSVKAVWDHEGYYLGESVNNFLGIRGLTCNEFTWYDHLVYTWAGKKVTAGGLTIDLNYTSAEAKNSYRWIQSYSENGGPWTFDNKSLGWDGQTEYSGSIAYYSSQELAKHINGNTISFYDRPNYPYIDSKDSNYSIKLMLSLYNGNNRPVFSLYYGYRLNNGNISLRYPKVLVSPH